MFYIFEMANNHQGSVEHAKRIIDDFSALASRTGITAGIKLQFRQLDTFIHDDFKNSDLKFVKRFNSTRLTKSEFSEILGYIKLKGLVTIATPFDNESIPWIYDLGVSVVKVASCSIDDWPLLEAIAKINKRIIISTGGANFDQMKQVYELFKHNQRDFAFMHCVGEYPTPVEASDMNRIIEMKEAFPDIEIGFSTHECPSQPSMAPIARTLGCTILEKHVGVPTETISLNKYSCTVRNMEDVINQVKIVEMALLGKSKTQKQTLQTLKRGVYLRNDIVEGSMLTKDDFYYCMPVQIGQFDASHVHELIGRTVTSDMKANAPLMKEKVSSIFDSNQITGIKILAKKLLNQANIPLSGKEKVELSAHYGLENFRDYGALIIDKINREYCKKLIVVLANQNHPTHYHIKKEEAFELLSGDCVLTLNGKNIDMKRGSPILIPRGIKHSFKSRTGCVIEEISTTHIAGDSIYEDPNINSLKVSDRKIKIRL